MAQVIWKQIYKLISMAWRRRYFIAIPFVCVFIITIIISLVSPKMYRSHTSILVQESALLNPFLEDLSVSSNLEDRMVALRVLVHSRNNLYSIAKENNLIEENSATQTEQVIQDLSDSIKLSLSGNDLVKITLTWPHASEIKNLLLSIRKRFVERLLAPSRTSIISSEAFLKAQLKVRSDELNSSELRLAKFRQENQNVLPELFVSNNKSLDQLRADIREKQITLSGVNAQYDSLKTKLSQTNPVIGVLEQQIIITKSNLSLLQAKYTDRHSKVIAQQQELNYLTKERNKLLNQKIALSDAELEQFWNIATKVDDEDSTNIPALLISQLEQIQRAKSKLTLLSEEIRILNMQEQEIVKALSAEADVSRQLRELMRDLTVNRKLYDELYNRHEMAKVTGELGRFEEPEKIKVIDVPFEPQAPINLPLYIYLLLGVFLGSIAGIATAVLVEMLDDKIWHVDQIKQITKLKIISNIPAIELREMKV